MTEAQEIRAGLESVAHALGAIAVALRPSMAAEGCQHPEELRDYAMAMMGHIQWTCQCGYHFDAKGGA